MALKREYPPEKSGVLKRRAIWRHNGFLGSARMMQMQCQAIMCSPTATLEAKVRASEICAKARDLYELLRERAI